MHSRIIQISKEPIEKDEYFSECRYYDGFINAIADYVVDSDRTADIEWLKSILGDAAEVDVQAGTFKIVNRMLFFMAPYTEFRQHIAEMEGITLEDFASCKSEFPMYMLQASYDDKYSFYLDSDENGMQTLMSFMRFAKDGDVYYIGATFDYHS